jgi:hypothetical protein
LSVQSKRPIICSEVSDGTFYEHTNSDPI